LKRQYHYLVAGLPELLLDEGRLKTTPAALKSDFGSALHPADLDLLKVLFLQFDNANLLNLLEKKEAGFDERGNFSQELLEEQIRDQDGSLPPYMNRFIADFKENQRDNPDMLWENLLELYYYEYGMQLENEFLAKWFAFQYNKRTLLTALISRKFELIAENHLPGDQGISSQLLRSNARDFGISGEFPEVEKVLQAFENENLMAREKALDGVDWEWIDENTFFNYFTIEKILGFFLQFMLADRWMKLDEKEGRKLFKELLEKLGESYELPGEFSLARIQQQKKREVE
jgi:hypothetical protein